MESAPELSPIAPIEPNAAHFFRFAEPPVLPPFMPNTLSSNTPSAGQNHDRTDRSAETLAPLPPIPPISAELAALQNNIPNATGPPPDLTAPPTMDTGAQEAQRPSAPDQEQQGDSDDGSSSEHEDSEGEEDPQANANVWQPIEEDKSAPCADELAWITSREEFSAADHEYWEKKIFFSIDDPEIVPLEHGRIDWLVERFNGTRENPNKELVMRSPVVRLGGYDWRIKFYPKGNNSDYLSVYIECVTMQSEEFSESAVFPTSPLPYLANREGTKQRQSVAVQLGVVMYNPGEPRVFEYQCDAHQFTKKSPDYGWTRFTHFLRRDFSLRMHGQRQAILRDDKLAFSAYIRIINDPTKCMWSHGSDCFNDSIALTALRPFSSVNSMFAAKIPLLHFAPFRQFIYQCNESKIVFWLQCLLWKMLSRTRSQHYGNPINSCQADAVAWLTRLTSTLRNNTDARAVVDLVGTFDPNQGAAVGKNKLVTSKHSSVQAAVDAHPTAIATPVLLTLELERENFDREARKWNKITNKVEIQNRIVVAGTPYILYAFSTHCGDLTSNNFNVYVRPQGPDTLWYAYTDGNVTALTHKQAVDAHCGFGELDSPRKESQPDRSLRRGFHRLSDWNEVTHVVHYVRDDHKSSLVNTPTHENWDVPNHIMEGKPPKELFDIPEPPPTANGEDRFSEDQIRELDEHIERARQANAEEISGAATPNGWITDGEDIVMTDPEVSPLEKAEEDLRASHLFCPDFTIDCLGREYYKGSLMGGYYHGEGHLIAMNGDEYTGSFLAGEKSGYGKMVYGHTGNVYEGFWQANEHHGQGKLTEAKTGNVFDGGWKNGKKSGSFVLKGTVTDEDKGCCSICYDKEINTAFYDCGHVVACRDCAYKMDHCPVCRRRVAARLELFGVKVACE